MRLPEPDGVGKLHQILSINFTPILKPVSAKALYDRLLTIMMQPQPGPQLGDYYGPEPRKLVSDTVEDLNLASSLAETIAI
jgi:hypothetical protein